MQKVTVMRHQVVIILLFVIGAGGGVVWSVAKNSDTQMRDELLQQARIAAYSLNSEHVTSLTGSPNDLHSPLYQRIKEQLSLMRNARQGCRFLYLMGQRPDGTVFFFVDSLPADSDDYAPPGLVYDEISDSYLHSFDTRKEAVVGPVTDRWGTLVTALIPLSDPQTGRLVAVLGMDVDAKDWRAEIFIRCLPLSAIILFVIFLILLLLSWRKAVKERQVSEGKHKLFFENAPIGIVHYSKDGVIVDINRAAITIFGSSREKLVGLDIDLIPNKAFSKGVYQSLQGEKGYFEGKYTSYTGAKESFLKVIWIPIFDDGKVVAGVGIVEDYTSRQKAEETLRKNEALLSSIFESIQDGISVLDRDLTVLHTNGVLKEWYKTKLPLEGQKCFSCYKDSESPCTPCPTLRCIESGRTEMEVVSGPSGSAAEYLEVYSYPVHGADGTAVVGVVEIIRDITERRRMEEQLLTNEKMSTIAGLAAGVAHEINTPLSAILQAHQLVALGLSPDEEHSRVRAGECGVDLVAVQEYFAKYELDVFMDGIRDSASRAGVIINNLLEFSNPTESNFTQVDLKDIMAKAVVLAQADYTMKKKFGIAAVEFIQEYAADMPHVDCVAAEIEQVLVILIHNSVLSLAEEGSTEKPRIVIRLVAADDRAILEVEDNGPGVPDDVKKKIFDPFFTTREVGQGTGLGLSVAHTIVVDKHLGKIRVESEPGRGARFIVELPLVHPGADSR